MRITILAIGTRGDIQPLVALGAGLQSTGRHQVCFVAPDDFSALAAGAGLDFHSLGLSIRDLLSTPAMRAFLEPGGNLIVGLWQLLQLLRPLFDHMMAQTWSAAQGADAIVFSTLALGGYHVAERLGVPGCWALPFPTFARTRVFPNVAFPALPLGGGYNRLTYRLAEQALHSFTARFFNQWRKCFDLPPVSIFRWPYDRLRGAPVPRLYSFSPIVLPRPSDWPEGTHITGYWYLDPPADWQPPADLLDFLSAGAPPVYVGFGSLPERSAARITQIVVDALRGAGQRGVLATGWGGLSRAAVPPSADVFFLEDVPHAWLFPRLAAIVHHGGSGTTGAALRAGVPMVMVPHAGDQPLWARCVVELGISPAPIPRRRLTADRLAEAISRAVADHDLQARAALIGERIRADDGIAQAIAVIERAAA